MNAILGILVWGMGAAVFGGPAANASFAVDVPPLTARVNDTAGLLGPAAVRALEEKLAAYEKATAINSCF